MNRVAVILGTRPEIIKLADIIKNLGDDALVIHSGQHYDPSMSGQFFDELGLPRPAITLEGVGGQDRATQIATTLTAVTAALLEYRPGAVIVQGDTNTAAAGALAANFLGIPVIHVEAGLRSRDRLMPEEINRQIAGVVADVHCAATTHNLDNLVREGVDPARIAVTGNTIVEVTRANLKAASHPVDAPKLRGDYILSTLHRPENTDTKHALRRVLHALSAADAPVVFVAHPRTLAAITRFDLQHLTSSFEIVEPTNHHEFLRLAANARLLVSDSGGIQEETTIIGKPLIVVRRSTERPEAIAAGFAKLVQPQDDLSLSISRALTDTKWQDRAATRTSPFGDGTASATIAGIARHMAAGASPESATADTNPVAA